MKQLVTSVAVMVCVLGALVLTGCGTKEEQITDIKMSPERVKQKLEYLQGKYEFEFQLYAEFRDGIGEYVVGSQPWKDGYMATLGARDRALKAGQDYVAFLEIVGHRTKGERKRVEAQLAELEALEEDIPYR